MNKSVTVVQGEASESDEDIPSCDPTTHGHGLGTAVPRLTSPTVAAIRNTVQKTSTSPGKQRITSQSIVVSGEASESSDEEIEIDTSTTESFLTPLQVNQTGKGDSVDLSPESESRSSSRLSQSSEREPDPKYDTLLHGKLRECNASLRRHLCDSLGQVYLSSAREIRNMTQSLLRSQTAIQDVSHNMGLLTNNLFHLEDKIDIIASCNLLPIIDISPAPTPTTQPPPLPGH